MLSCRETARLISLKLDGQLPWYRYPRLLFHWSICKTTRAYARQAAALQRIVVQEQETGLMPAPALDPERRRRLKERLRESTHQNGPPPAS